MRQSGGSGTGGGDMYYDDGMDDGGMMYYDEDEESTEVTIDKASSFEYIEVEPLFITQELEKVEIDLSSFNTKRIKIRFRFDSADE